MNSFVPNKYSIDMTSISSSVQDYQEIFKKRERPDPDSYIRDSIRRRIHSSDFVEVRGSKDEFATVGIVERHNQSIVSEDRSLRSGLGWTYVAIEDDTNYNKDLQPNQKEKVKTEYNYKPKYLHEFTQDNKEMPDFNAEHPIENLDIKETIQRLKPKQQRIVIKSPDKQKKVEKLVIDQSVTHKQLYAMEQQKKKLALENDKAPKHAVILAYSPEVDTKIKELKKDTTEEDAFDNKKEVKFSTSELEIKSIKRVSEVLGSIAPVSLSNCELASKVQSLTLIKEKPSSINASVLQISENIISVSPAEEIKVTASHESKEDKYEVEEGYTIFKSLNPAPWCRRKFKMKPQSSGVDVEKFKLAHKEICENEGAKHNECTEFLNPIEVAKLFVVNTIENAKQNFHLLIKQYGDPEKRLSRLSILPPPRIPCQYWSAIKQLNVEEGLFLIERYIVFHSVFKEDWKYTINFEGAQSDKVSDHYFYEANFSLPCKLYPIAQVTASLYFHIEVSRVIPPDCPVKVSFRCEGSHHRLNPERFILRDKFLERVLDTKLKLFQKYGI